MDNPISFRDLFSEDIQGGIDGLISQIGQVESSLVKMLQDVKKEASGLSEALAGTSSVSKGDRDATSQYAAEIEKLHDANEKLVKSLDSVQKQLDAMKQKKKTDKDTSVDLAKSYESLSELIKSTGVNLEELLASEKQKQIADKNGVTANTALEGSYNKLYAQYNLVKNVLNAMGKEMREDINIGKKWEAQALEMMNTMKGMQEATGKHTLSVGDYSKALNGLNISTQQVLREMPTIANSWSQFIIAISNNVPIFTDSVKRVVAETGSWKVAMSGVITSLFSWQTALLVLLTILPKIAKNISDKKKEQTEDNEVTKAAIALHQQLNRVYQDTDKQINESVSKLRSVYLVSQDTNRSMQERIAAAQSLKTEYKDAFENYSAEEIALGKAKTLYDNLTDSLVLQAKARAYLNKITELESQMIDQTAIRDQAKADRDVAEAELERAKAQLASYDALVKEQHIIGASGAEYATFSRRIAEAQEEYDKANATFMEADEPLQEIDNKIEDLRKHVPALGLDVKNTGNETKNTIGKIKDYYWDYLESKANIENDEENRELELNEIAYAKKIESYQKELDERKKAGNLNVEQEKYINGIIDNLAVEANQKRWEIIWKWYDKTWNAIKDQFQEEVKEETIDEEDLSISGQYEKILAENANKLLASRQRLNDALENGTYREAKAEGKTFKDLTIEKLKLEEELQEALLKMRLETGEITKDQYDIQLAELQTNLAKAIAKVTKGKRRKFDLWTLMFGETKDDGFGGVYKELSAEAQSFVSAFESAMSQAFEYMDEWMDKRIEMAEIAVEAAEKESEAAKTALDYEMEARANGYANNVELARKEYEEKLELERQAVAEKERLEKIQEGIDSATQLSSLITATAELWAAHASIPFGGTALAIAATAAMWGSFAAAKITAAQMTATKYGEGMSEYLDYGGSHASGNDIDFGADKNGRRRRVERGEMIGVINKRNVEKYGVNRITDIISSLNKGTFENKYSTTAQTEAINQMIMRESILKSIGLNRTTSLVENLERSTFDDKYGLAFAGLEGASTDLSTVERGINKLVEQGEVKIVSTPTGRIEYRGNNKRIIRNS